MSKITGTISNNKNITGQLNASNGVSINLVGGGRGKSAYELWLDEGNQGSVEDFLDSLRADGGANYNGLSNKPKIENVELFGNKTFEDLGVETIVDSEITNLF